MIHAIDPLPVQPLSESPPPPKMMVLAHETGHRIGAIRQLRWADIDLEKEEVRWRAEAEKNGYEHATPMTEAAKAAFSEARKHSLGNWGGSGLPRTAEWL